ncbi:serine protease [Candidatus Binatia bacterium]|nr:serine protease [Candidatus Binatia bacterium]
MLALLQLLPSPSLASSSDAAPVAEAKRDPGASPADGQPAPVARAMRAGVLIESVRPGGRAAFASGVVLRLRHGRALIATAQHVVNPGFPRVEQPPDVRTPTAVSVTTIDGTRATARVEWLAPHGIDLAIVFAPVAGKQVREAPWDASARPAAGAALFAIGNPGDGRWVRSDGTLARIRDVEQDGFAFELLQTTVPVLPGDSGGGLYDTGGRLIGVTSMHALTSDPRSPGDVAFAQALPTLLGLAPRRLGLPERNP